MEPAFTGNVVKSFLPIFNEETDKIVKSINQNYLNGAEFNLLEMMAELVINTNNITIFNLHDQQFLAQQVKIE